MAKVTPQTGLETSRLSFAHLLQVVHSRVALTLSVPDRVSLTLSHCFYVEPVCDQSQERSASNLRSSQLVPFVCAMYPTSLAWKVTWRKMKENKFSILSTSAQRWNCCQEVCLPSIWFDSFTLLIKTCEGLHLLLKWCKAFMGSTEAQPRSKNHQLAIFSAPLKHHQTFKLITYQ